ncbi:murein hydrolase transporter LrgA [Agaricicola taiwanensis]|uniref:Murein hydrolase transporter LrgA n=1 Tax=Agaricicola taiwanensis TaxID=591372 RepID=A0A8J2VI20_9RHOB|nr:CidA/LrgA family protein [Agaricicola taiwanensis]GGE31332.1 murein hydrolase transporter LrgA [Agaricicola taiwanensis]
MGADVATSDLRLEPAMLHAVAVLLVAQLAGEILVRLSGIPVPGPVVGMLLLIIGLVLRQHALGGADVEAAAGPVASVADTLLRNMSLMFIPAGCGIIERLDDVAPHVLALMVILIVSTFLALVATACTFVAVRRLTSRG